MRKCAIGLFLLSLLILAGSAFFLIEAGTKVTRQWVSPDIAKYKFDHLLAICIVKDSEVRRVVEDNLAAQAKKDNAFQSYNVLTEDDMRDKEAAKRKILELGFDGAVIIRPLGVKDKVNYVPGYYPPYYGTFWGYYNYAWPALYAPDYVYTDKVVQVETMIFSIKDDRLLWTLYSDSTNPETIQEIIGGIAKAIYKEARKRGVVK
jgi:hypothetical protein